MGRSVYYSRRVVEEVCLGRIILTTLIRTVPACGPNLDIWQASSKARYLLYSNANSCLSAVALGSI